MRGVTREAFPEDFAERRYHQANSMGGVPIVGDPDAVAQALAQLAATGARGIALSFVNYLDELPLFRDEVLPRLARIGLRETN
jgi:alkanesulfonate monooxygenase SsuD/methylene tetrahydromethanopterin reductase-like flavin-dependent oxidoreductase (luciferase family)